MNMKNANIFLKTQDESHIISAMGVYKFLLYEEISEEKLNTSDKLKNCTNKMLKIQTEVQLLNEVCCEAYLYGCKPNWYLFVCPYFRKDNIVRYTKKLFTCDDFIANPEIVPVCFYVDKDELFIGICNQLGITSSLEIIQEHSNTFKIIYQNKIDFISFFDIPENAFNDIYTNCKFSQIVQKISQMLELPLDITFNKIKRAPQHMNAFRYRE